MTAQGSDEESAAALMGAGWIRIFRKITFPHIMGAFVWNDFVYCKSPW